MKRRTVSLAHLHVDRHGCIVTEQERCALRANYFTPPRHHHTHRPANHFSCAAHCSTPTPLPLVLRLRSEIEAP